MERDVVAMHSYGLMATLEKATEWGAFILKMKNGGSSLMR
jgi:hypothetical protein